MRFSERFIQQGQVSIRLGSIHDEDDAMDVAYRMVAEARPRVVVATREHGVALREERLIISLAAVLLHVGYQGQSSADLFNQALHTLEQRPHGASAGELWMLLGDAEHDSEGTMRWLDRAGQPIRTHPLVRWLASENAAEKPEVVEAVWSAMVVALRQFLESDAYQPTVFEMASSGSEVSPNEFPVEELVGVLPEVGGMPLSQQQEA